MCFLILFFGNAVPNIPKLSAQIPSKFHANSCVASAGPLAASKAFVARTEAFLLQSRAKRWKGKQFAASQMKINEAAGGQRNFTPERCFSLWALIKKGRGKQKVSCLKCSGKFCGARSLSKLGSMMMLALIGSIWSRGKGHWSHCNAKPPRKQPEVRFWPSATLSCCLMVTDLSSSKKINQYTPISHSWPSKMVI